MRPQLVSAAAGLLLGCATVDMTRIAQPDDAPPLMLGLIVEGPEHSIDKEDRCRGVGQRLGVHVVPHEQEAVTAQLHLQDGKNQLSVMSKRRGVVLREPREDWSMEALCADAFRRAAVQFLSEARSGRARAMAQAARTAAPQAVATTTAPEPTSATTAPGPDAETDDPGVTPAEPMTPGIVPVTPVSSRPVGTRLLSVNTEPAGATLWVDGAPRGSAPLAAEQVAPGDHVVEALWPDGRWMVVGARLRRGSARTITLRVVE